MITLKTLKDATDQEIFDQVATHLVTQNAKAVGTCDSGLKNCMYRTKDDLKCAVGCLIGDDEYNPKMEGSNWDTISHWYPVNCTVEQDLLICNLQNIHDCYEPSEWKRLLRNLAQGNHLNIPAILE